VHHLISWLRFFADVVWRELSKFSFDISKTAKSRDLKWFRQQEKSPAIPKPLAAAISAEAAFM
jgi:hypothetical protein